MFRMVGGSLGVAVTGAIFQGSVGTADFADASPQQFVDALGNGDGRLRRGRAGRRRGRRGRDPRQAQGGSRRGGRGGGQPRRRGVAAREAVAVERRRLRRWREARPARRGSAEVEAAGSVSTSTSPRAAIVSRLELSTRLGCVRPGREHDDRDLEAGGARRLDRQQRVVDRAEPGRGGDRPAAARGRRRGRGRGSRRRAGRAGRRLPSSRAWSAPVLATCWPARA